MKEVKGSDKKSEQKANVENLVNDIFNEAKADIADERLKELKIRVKAKLEQRAKAQLVVDNIDREIEEMKLEVAQVLQSL